MARPRSRDTDRAKVMVRFTGAAGGSHYVLDGKIILRHGRVDHRAARRALGGSRGKRGRRGRQGMTKVAFVVGHEDSRDSPSDTPEAYWRVLIPARRFGTCRSSWGVANAAERALEADVVWIHQPTCFAAAQLAEDARGQGKAGGRRLLRGSVGPRGGRPPLLRRPPGRLRAGPGGQQPHCGNKCGPSCQFSSLG